MSKLIIKGGHPISGIVTPVANKNSILKILPATILLDCPVRLFNVPKSSSVKVMLDILESLGADVQYDKDSLLIDTRKVEKYEIPDDLAEKERAALMFLGPLVSRFGKAEVKDAGGCKLGVRPVDTLFQGLRELGLDVSYDKKYTIGTKSNHTDNADKFIWQLEQSVTGTENLILASVKRKGSTTIYNAACEPHTQDLCNFLVKAGARINGIGTNKLEIVGVNHLGNDIGELSWNIIPDHIDIGGWIVAAAVTGGKLTIKDAIPTYMTQILHRFEQVNLKYEIRGEDIYIPSEQNLNCKLNLKGNIDKIKDEPWPGYPADLIPQAIILCAAANGNMRVCSFMYETQLFFTEELIGMNGKVHLANPHVVVTMGPSKFRAGKFNCPSIIQCAHALVLAALAADGETTLNNAESLLRRYPDLDEKLRSLGADVEEVI